MNLRKLNHAVSTATVLFVITLAGHGFSQSACCLSTLMKGDSLVSQMTASGYRNVTLSPNNSCSYFGLSGTISMTIMGTLYTTTLAYTYRIVDGSGLEFTSNLSTNGAPGIVEVDTFPNWCAIAVEKGFPASSSASNLTVSPNPFTSQVAFGFQNPSANASLRVFDIRGAEVFKMKNIQSNKVEWKPAALRPGIYFVQVITLERILTTRISCLK